jgi:hypothetical protein
METAEGAFIETVRVMAIKRVLGRHESEQNTIEWNYSLVNDTIKSKGSYPAVLINQVIGAKEHELPMVLHTGYRLYGDNYVLWRK